MSNTRTIYQKDEDWKRINAVAVAKGVSVSQEMRDHFNAEYRRLLKKGEV